MENHIFIFKQKKSLSYKIVAGLMTIFGLLWIQYFLFGGVVLSLGSLMFFAYNEGTEVNFKDNIYRDAIYFGTAVIGKWKKLPEIKYISVFRTTLVSSISGRSGATVSNREKVVLINLIHGNNERILVYKTDELNDAFDKAENFSKELNVDIYDATSRVGKWYEKTLTN